MGQVNNATQRSPMKNTFHNGFKSTSDESVYRFSIYKVQILGEYREYKATTNEIESGEVKKLIEIFY